MERWRKIKDATLQYSIPTSRSGNIEAMRDEKMLEINSEDRGFTLIEILVVIVILGILVSYVGVRIIGRTEEARRTQAQVQIGTLETALKLYRLDNGYYPTTEQGLQALVEPPAVGRLPKAWREGGYLEKGKLPKDPWDNDYIYICPGVHGDFDLVSYGADGEPGGEGKDEDINNWELG